MTDNELTLGDILATATKEINERNKYAPKPHPDEHLQFYLDIPLDDLMAICIKGMTWKMLTDIAEIVSPDYDEGRTAKYLHDWAMTKLHNRTPS